MMSLAEEGAFIHLLCHAWADPDCTLPDDDASLAMLSRLGDAWASGSGQKLRGVFISDPDRPGRIYNPRQRSVREAQTERIIAARNHGLAGSNGRWKLKNARALPEHSASSARALPEHSVGNASSPVGRRQAAASAGAARGYRKPKPNPFGG